MIPIRLSLQNFLSYHQKTEIDFQPIHLACISGNNGAGKSSLLDAITWALFGKARRTDDALIFGNADECEVTLEFEYEGDRYRIRRTRPRGKTGALEFFFRHDDSGDWRNITEKSLRETEARIQQTLRMDYETFTNASFFLQGKADQFAQQKPGDRKRILGSILGLDVWETYKERASDKRKLVERDLATTDTRMEDIRLELNEEDQRKERLQQIEERRAIVSTQRQNQETQLDQLRQIEGAVKEQKKVLDSLNSQRQSLEANRRQAETQLKLRLNERDGIQSILDRAEQIRANYAALQELRTRLESLNLLAGQAHDLERQMLEPRLSMEKKRATFQQEQQQLKQQQQQAEDILARKTEKESEWKTLQEQIEQIRPVAAGKAEIETEIGRLRQHKSDLKAENTRLKTEMDELVERRKQLEETHESQCPLCGQDLSPEHRQQVLADIQNQGKEKGDAHRVNQKSLQEAENGLVELETRLTTAQQAENRLNALLRQNDQIQNWFDQNQPVLAAWQSGGMMRLQELSVSLSDESYLQSEQAIMADLKNELDSLGYNAVEHTRLREQENDIRPAEAEFRQLDQVNAALPPLDRDIAGIRQQLEQIDHQSVEIQSQHTDISASYGEMAARLPDLRAMETALRGLIEQENQLHQEEGAARQKVTVLVSLRKKMDDFTREREELAVRAGRYRTLEKAFSKDGVPALLIEQALPEIEAQANDLLDRLSSGAMSIRFLTQRDYKDKSRDDKKETLDIQISDPSGMRDYEMFSGGEAFRVNFAIRLALSRVLAQRSGARLQTLVIDEGFGSQDASGRQRLIEAINMVQHDFAKVLVITHLEELKDAFPHRIEVEKLSVGSTVRVMA